MFKELDNGLLVQVGADGSEKLVIDSSRLEECVKFVREGSINSISINPYKGYRVVRKKYYVESVHVDGLLVIFGNGTYEQAYLLLS